ncbi:serine/threonine-protein phosphatase with EF-hands 2-like [Ruditapes philippinarum]|uniref:serine/threonine-protein phosphatase with EF-hands 2-like n=1 Tax=Ruditapes philippinarum TaxID=129788 RepID=UPI00295AA4B7|nr:serine/threonine-protein phosphatase with EF-hands 2-like [Ruditapes philippinarum]
MGCSPSRKRIYGFGTKRLRAALLIQKWYRRYRAHLEVRRRCTWNIFQSIEYAGEQDQLKLHNFFNKMLLNMSTDDGQAPLISALNVNKEASIYDTQTVSDNNSEIFDKYLDGIKVENSYKGIHLKFPLTLNQLHKMVQAFKRNLTLHAKYTIQLLLETRKILKTQANIRYATTSLSKQITVCGDIHGKLSDLYMVFHKNGLPAVNNPYIFNGDFVDRGHFSTEVALVIFSCFIMNPNEVYINRGNHEDHVMNLRYGFVKEIEKKYRQHSKKIIHLFRDVFSWLPLATMVDEQILVCHGGISDSTDLQRLSTIDRHRYLSTLQPPGGCDDISTMSQDDLIEWKQILDLLWSDPKPNDGCQPNTFRGGGVYFGPDVSARFLEENKLKLLIRSHECKPEGFEYTHDGKVLTIFSASNYYETGSNLGAFVRIQGQSMECQIIQFTSSHSPVLRKISFTQRINLVEKSALSDLRDRLLASKSELLNEFSKYDPDKTGKINCADWSFAMETVLEMELPWRTLRSKLAETDEEGNVLYETSFETLQVKHRYSGNGPSITETLYRHKDSLETIFRMIDTDHSGQISMPEFEDALSILIKQLDLAIQERDIRDIAESIDMNKDGCIDFNEFLEAFRIVDSMGKDKTKTLKTEHNAEISELPAISENLKT